MDERIKITESNGHFYAQVKNRITGCWCYVSQHDIDAYIPIAFDTYKDAHQSAERFLRKY